MWFGQTQGGYLPYKDIAVIRNQADAHEVHDEKTGAMYMTYDHDQWVSFDTPETLKDKVDYANSIGYVILPLPRGSLR